MSERLLSFTKVFGEKGPETLRYLKTVHKLSKLKATGRSTSLVRVTYSFFLKFF
jgi:hypothetical protein